MSTGDKKLKPPCFVEVASLNDFARLTCALERMALPIFSFRIKGENILATQLDLFRRTPVIYYVRSRDTGSFLGYRSVGEREVVELSSSTRDATNTYAPIISVEKLPEVFEKGFEKKVEQDKYLAMKVGDLASLCKIALYKMVYEEAPLPLFTFPENGRWALGAFTRLDEVDEAAIFFHTILDNPPQYSFVKYSSMNPEKTEFTVRIDEHGYLYGKITRLAERHPMVDI